MKPPKGLAPCDHGLSGRGREGSLNVYTEYTNIKVVMLRTSDDLISLSHAVYLLVLQRADETDGRQPLIRLTRGTTLGVSGQGRNRHI